MDMLKRFDPLWIVLLVAAGLNYACIALFDTNVVTEIFTSDTAADVVYCVFGFAALMMVPKMLAGMHMPHHHHTHPHGA
jgi:uncharacterized membrane protein YuzA (DUF378 family)